RFFLAMRFPPPIGRGGGPAFSAALLRFAQPATLQLHEETSLAARPETIARPSAGWLLRLYGPPGGAPPLEEAACSFIGCRRRPVRVEWVGALEVCLTCPDHELWTAERDGPR